MSLTKVTFSLINGAAINPLDYWTSGDVGVAFNAAIAAMPSTGGVLDCRGMVGNYTASTTITITKPVEILLGAATITWSVAPAIEQTTGATLSIKGAGTQASILKSNANGHLISAVATGVPNSNLIVENVGLLDGLTTSGATFAQWSSTRTLGSAIYMRGTASASIRNVYSHGYLHCVDADNIVTSTFEKILAQWGGSHHFKIGIFCTSLVFNNCYSFAPMEDGYHFAGNILYCTLNSCASDSAGKYGYYFGPDLVLAQSPIDFTLNSCGSEGCGVNPAFAYNWANMCFDGARSFSINDCTFVGLGNTIANTCDALKTFDTSNPTSQITINGGHFGFTTSTSASPPTPGYFGGYTLNLVAGTTTGKGAITVARVPAEFAALAGGVTVVEGINDPNGALFYAHGDTGLVQSLATNTWATILVVPSYNTFGSWIITASADAGGTASVWTGVLLLTSQSATYSLTPLLAGGSVTFQMNGSNLQAKHVLGAASNLSYSIRPL